MRKIASSGRDEWWKWKLWDLLFVPTWKWNSNFSSLFFLLTSNSWLSPLAATAAIQFSRLPHCCCLVVQPVDVHKTFRNFVPNPRERERDFFNSFLIQILLQVESRKSSHSVMNSGWEKYTENISLSRTREFSTTSGRLKRNIRSGNTMMMMTNTQKKELYMSQQGRRWVFFWWINLTPFTAIKLISHFGVSRKNCLYFSVWCRLDALLLFCQLFHLDIYRPSSDDELKGVIFRCTRFFLWIFNCASFYFHFF